MTEKWSFYIDMWSSLAGKILCVFSNYGAGLSISQTDLECIMPLNWSKTEKPTISTSEFLLILKRQKSL